MDRRGFFKGLLGLGALVIAPKSEKKDEIFERRCSLSGSVRSTDGVNPNTIIGIAAENCKAGDLLEIVTKGTEGIF